MLHAFVLIDAEPSRIAALGEELSGTDGITEVFSVAGGVADLIAIVRVRHHDVLHEGDLGVAGGLPSARIFAAGIIRRRPGGEPALGGRPV